jgi:uncharacterized protein YjaG (DUF416 family)
MAEELDLTKSTFILLAKMQTHKHEWEAFVDEMVKNFEELGEELDMLMKRSRELYEKKDCEEMDAQIIKSLENAHIKNSEEEEVDEFKSG